MANTKITTSQKQRLINEIIARNPNMHQVATSAVWMGAPALVDAKEKKTKNGIDISFKMINMTINLPFGASFDGDYIVRDGVRIELCRP